MDIISEWNCTSKAGDFEYVYVDPLHVDFDCENCWMTRQLWATVWCPWLHVIEGLPGCKPYGPSTVQQQRERNGYFNSDTRTYK